MTKHKQQSICPCQSGKSLDQCCQPFLEGKSIPATAELLMRSRYSAYALNLPTYLQTTWHASTRPAESNDDGPSLKWLGLEILDQHTNDDEAFVHFIATCKVSGRLTRMEENSRFVREDGRWWYVDGEING